MDSFWQLCGIGDLVGVRAAIARGQDVNEASGRGYGNFTGLMRAVADSNNDIVKLLLEQPNVDLNCTTVNGQTALHEAAVNDNFQGVKQLLAYPRLNDANHKNNSGSSPAMRAMIYKKRNALRELLSHPSVDLDTRDRKGKSLEERAG